MHDLRFSQHCSSTLKTEAASSPKRR